MRPGICMECNKEVDRINERHTAVDCINGLKAKIVLLQDELKAANAIIRSAAQDAGMHESEFRNLYLDNL